MYKVTLKGEKSILDNSLITQELKFEFDDFDSCRQFVDLALFFSSDPNAQVILELEKETQDDK